MPSIFSFVQCPIHRPSFTLQLWLIAEIKENMLRFSLISKAMTHTSTTNSQLKIQTHNQLQNETPTIRIVHRYTNQSYIHTNA